MAEEALRRQAVPDRPCRLWAGGGGPRWTQGSATCASRPSLWPLHQLQHHGGHHSWDGVSVRVLCSQCVPKLATCQKAFLTRKRDRESNGGSRSPTFSWCRTVNLHQTDAFPHFLQGFNSNHEVFCERNAFKSLGICDSELKGQ